MHSSTGENMYTSAAMIYRDMIYRDMIYIMT